MAASCNATPETAVRDYAILVREREGRLPDIQTVPYGFSWGAFLFQTLWALYRGVWITALILLVAAVLASWLGALAGLGETGRVVLEIATSLVLALVANDLRRWELQKRRFRLVTIVSARRIAEAEAAGIHAYVDQRVDETEISPKQGLQAPAEQAI